MTRKHNPLKDYDFVTREAMSDEGMGARYATYFHCFNPNGAYERLLAMHRRINEWIDAHPERPNGVLYVHGSLNDHPRKTLFEVLDLIKKRRAHQWALQYAVRLIEKDIKRGDEFIADPALWPRSKSELHKSAVASKAE